MLWAKSISIPPPTPPHPTVGEMIAYVLNSRSKSYFITSPFWRVYRAYPWLGILFAPFEKWSSFPLGPLSLYPCGRSIFGYFWVVHVSLVACVVFSTVSSLFHLGRNSMGHFLPLGAFKTNSIQRTSNLLMFFFPWSVSNSQIYSFILLFVSHSVSISYWPRVLFVYLGELMNYILVLNLLLF